MKLQHSILLAIGILVATNSTAQNGRDVYNEGLELKKKGSVSLAKDKFKEAYRLDPTLTEALYERGWCESELKEYASALSTLRKVRLSWSNYAKVHFEIGYAFRNLNQIDSALVCFEKTLEINPTYMGSFKEMANIYYDKDNYPKALEYYVKYVSNPEREVKDYLVWYRKGYCENNGKDYTNAKVSLNKSLEFKTDHVNTYLELGYACSKLKENDEAIRWYNKAIELQPNSHVPHNGIAEVYRDNLKDMETAMTWYGKTLNLNKEERKANFGMGYCLNAKGRYTEAIPYLNQAIKSEATYTAAFTELGYSYYKTGNNSQAIEALKKSISLNSKTANPYYYLTLVYINMKDKNNAQKTIDVLQGINAKYATELQPKVSALP